MKYRKLTFMMIFLSVLLFVYLQPVFFPLSTNPKPHSNTIMNNQPKTNQSQTANLPADKYAQMIGQDYTKIKSQFAAELSTVETGYGYTQHLFVNQDNHYHTDIITRNNKIHAITVFGNSGKIDDDFRLGMNLEDILKKTEISATVTINNQSSEYQFELSEEDMNYRPLIHFDNQVSAIFYFHQVTGKLFAIRYFDDNYLLKSAPYQLIKGNYGKFDEENNPISWDYLSVEKAKYLLTVLNLFSSGVEYSWGDSSVSASSLLNQITLTPEKFLSTSRILQLNQMRKQRNMPYFSFTNDELKNLLEANHLQNTSGIFLTPAVDCMDIALQLQTDPILHNKMLSNQSKTLSIAFHKQDMLVLLLDK